MWSSACHRRQAPGPKMAWPPPAPGVGNAPQQVRRMAWSAGARRRLPTACGEVICP